MGTAETLSAINRLEQAVPVTDWNAAGIRVWPLVRAALSWRSVPGGSRRGEPPRYERTRLLGQMASTRARSLLADRSDRAHRAPTGEGYDAVFLTSGISKVWLETGWYDRLTDPFRELLARRGLSSLHLEPGRRFAIPRQYPSRFVQPALDLAILRSIGTPGRSPGLDLPGFEEFERAAREAGLDTRDAGLAAIARQIRQLRRVAEIFERLLREARPKLGFVVGYGIPSMAFNLACARVGIPSVEIQHGVQGPLHWAYSRWSALPSAGYELLPTAYWVWSEEEASVIEQWSSAAFPRHHAVAGGNLWLDAWRELTSEPVRAADQRVRFAKQRAPGERHVLIPMQTRRGDPSSLAPFLAAVAARPAWRWWIRAHPGMTAGEAASAKRTFSEIEGSRLELEASELPLYAVLRHVDAVATMASTVVIEASDLGVPSVLAEADAAGHYEGEIASGWVGVADGPLHEALEAQIERTRGLPSYEKPRLAPERALDELFPG